MAQWTDYEPYKDRSVAEFRAKREMSGLSTYDVAHELGVAVNTVKRWENPHYFPPSPAAWRFIDRAYEQHKKKVSEIIDKAIEEFDENDEKPIVIGWYRNGKLTGRDVGESNAISQAVAESLISLGYPIRIVWADPEDDLEQIEAISSFYHMDGKNPANI